MAEEDCGHVCVCVAVCAVESNAWSYARRREQPEGDNGQQLPASDADSSANRAHQHQLQQPGTDSRLLRMCLTSNDDS